MSAYRTLLAGIAAAMLLVGLGSGPAGAATFVYVSHNEDGDIGVYTLRPTGRSSPARASRRRGRS